MDTAMRTHANQIIASSIRAVQPDDAVARALKGASFPGRVILVAAGKAAWNMAKAARDYLGDRIEKGIVITKYDHVKGPLGKIDCREAGHPVPDENSFAATQAAIDLVSGLTGQDTVLFLLSGGGSALFEKPKVSGEELQDITSQLLACGADIVEINTIRKRLSAVKGGRFAELCAPARVFSIVLSDILGDPLDMIASGPAVPDSTTCDQALAIAEKYHLRLTPEAEACLHTETPKELHNVTTQITGSVRELCAAAGAECEKLGYTPVLLTDQLWPRRRAASLVPFSGPMPGRGRSWPSWPAVRPWSSSPVTARAGEIRSLLWPQHLIWRGCPASAFSVWAAMALTAPRMPPAAMWTANPTLHSEPRDCPSTMFCRRTMLITPWKKSAVSSSPVPPAPTSTT